MNANRQPALEARLVTARDIMARAIDRCLDDEKPSRDAVFTATRIVRALMDAGLTIQDVS